MELDNFMNIADACIILHNLIFRMQKSCYFNDEAGVEDMIMDFMNDDVGAANEADE